MAVAEDRTASSQQDDRAAGPRAEDGAAGPRTDDGTAGPRPEDARSVGRPSPQQLRSDLVGWDDAERRRVLATYTDQVYGRPPTSDVALSWRILRETPGPAGSVRRQISLELRPHEQTGQTGENHRRGADPRGADEHEAPRLTLLVQIPDEKAATGDGTSAAAGGATSAASGQTPPAVPAFLGLNFQGNHTLTDDPEILDPDEITDIAGSALHDGGRGAPADGPPARGCMSHAWAADLIARRGHATITACYREIGPDTTGIVTAGWHPHLWPAALEDRPGGSGGAITLWAWALQRVLDALEQGMVPEIDPSRVIVHGHSRLGKAALWAAAQDERFAAAISNDSGCMGAAIDRGIGESHEQITTAFPHWFAPDFVRRIADGHPAPADQHQLLAMIAPRPLYVASASEDLHADPVGEFAGWQIAADAWGADGTDVTFPDPDQATSVPGVPLAYHVRRGGHGVQRFDWEHWLDFADRWVGAG